jgi:hypothetical protein
VENENKKHTEDQYNLICPECGVANLKGTENCLVCDRNLKDTVAFFEDDSFDLEITKNSIIEYKKSFWGDRRTGKVNKYILDKIENIEFGSPVSRFIFIYEGKRVVLPMQKENLEKLKEVLNH